MAGGVGPLLFVSEDGESSCGGAGRGEICPVGVSGSNGSCLGLVAFFKAGGVSGGVSGTKADIGVGGGGGEGSPSGEGLGSAGILAIIAEGAPGPGSARGPFSMVVASMEVLGGLSGGGGDGPRPGRGSRGASRPARPAGNDLEAAALGVEEVEAGGQ